VLGYGAQFEVVIMYFELENIYLVMHDFGSPGLRGPIDAPCLKGCFILNRDKE